MENFRIKDGMLLKYTGEGKVVTIPDGVHRIGINAFAHNERVTQIYLSNSVRTIGKGAFAHCPHLEEVIFSPEVTEICHFALYDCPNLQRVALPETVKLIGRQAFGKCKSLASFSGSNDIEFDSTAFLGCLHLADEQGFVILGDILHFYTGNHSKICVPKGVKEIGASAFSGNSALKKVALPVTLTTIHYTAFLNCKQLEIINVPEGILYHGESQFRGCTGLADEKGLVVVAGTLFDYVGDDSHFLIPEGVKKISIYAIRNRPNLTQLTLPNGLEFVARQGVTGCQNLKMVRLQDENITFSEESFYYDNGISEVEYPKGLEIPHRAFFPSEEVGYYGKDSLVVGGEILFCEVT